jgi:hypothetical protein
MPLERKRSKHGAVLGKAKDNPIKLGKQQPLRKLSPSSCYLEKGTRWPFDSYELGGRSLSLNPNRTIWKSGPWSIVLRRVDAMQAREVAIFSRDRGDNQ